MCSDPMLLCLDEPAAGLNPRESAELNELLRFICREQKISVLLIEHDMGVVMEISDHIVVLDYGEKISDGTADFVRNDPRVIAAYLGVEDEEVRGGRAGGGAVSSPLLAVRGVTTYYGKIIALRGVDIDVNQGEIVTLIGANGAGKSTLMMTICGTPRARDGSIVFDGTEITRMPTHEIMRMAIAQAPEGRRIFPRMTVLENLQMGAAAIGFEHFDEDLEQDLRDLPGAQAPGRPARRHAVGRRAADAGDRPGADEPAAPSPARRALARPRAADRPPDLRRAPRPQQARGTDRVPGRAERLPRAQAGQPRLCHGQRPASPCPAPARSFSPARKCARPIWRAAATERPETRCRGSSCERELIDFLLVTCLPRRRRGLPDRPRGRADLAADRATSSLYLFLVTCGGALHPLRPVRAARCSRFSIFLVDAVVRSCVSAASVTRSPEPARWRGSIRGSTSGRGRLSWRSAAGRRRREPPISRPGVELRLRARRDIFEFKQGFHPAFTSVTQVTDNSRGVASHEEIAFRRRCLVGDRCRLRAPPAPTSRSPPPVR